MACGDIKARFRMVILDPVLLVSVPQKVAAATGIDAIAHALESYVCMRANPVSRLFSKEAWRLLAKNFIPSLQNSKDLSILAEMLLGSHLAGNAIENSMLGAAHACANPLTAKYGLMHGLAVGLMRDCGVEERELPALAQAAMQEWTGTFNPRPLTEGEVLSLYASAY
jgi:alcohol dehydrogenase